MGCYPSQNGSWPSINGVARGRNRVATAQADQLTKLITQVRKSISRLIDAYGDGLLEKLEFEPRVTAARERLSRLEQEQKEVSAFTRARMQS